MPVFSLVDMTELQRYPIRMSEVRSSYSQGTSEKLAWSIVKTREEALALVDKLMVLNNTPQADPR